MIKVIRTFIFFFLFIGCLSGCQVNSKRFVPTPTRLSQSLGIGTEMYSWQNEQGEWHFSLLGGTNRLKTKEEITGSPFGVKEIKANLCHLSLQDQVVWMNLSVDDGNPQLAFPPDSIMKEIQETAQDCDINLRVVKK